MNRGQTFDEFASPLVEMDAGEMSSEYLLKREVDRACRLVDFTRKYGKHRRKLVEGILSKT
jgi:hypothetical protein